MIQAAGNGTIQILLASPAADRDPELATAMLDAVLGQILSGASSEAPHTPVAAAVALRAFAPDLDVLTDSERRLLSEWLDRLTDHGATPRSPVPRRKTTRS